MCIAWLVASKLAAKDSSSGEIVHLDAHVFNVAVNVDKMDAFWIDLGGASALSKSAACVGCASNTPE